MILGAVLAGGRSNRFGSDKALAQIGGETLIERAVRPLSSCCDDVVVVGRETAPAPALPDWPRPGAGPLGGIAGALRHAQAHGYASALTPGVNSVGLPHNLVELLSPAPAHLRSQPVVGHWPQNTLGAVETIFCGAGSHSMRTFAQATGGRPVSLPRKPANINPSADLAAAESHYGL